METNKAYESFFKARSIYNQSIKLNHHTQSQLVQCVELCKFALESRDGLTSEERSELLIIQSQLPSVKKDKITDFKDLFLRPLNLFVTPLLDRLEKHPKIFGGIIIIIILGYLAIFPPFSTDITQPYRIFVFNQLNKAPNNSLALAPSHEVFSPVPKNGMPETRKYANIVLSACDRCESLTKELASLVLFCKGNDNSFLLVPSLDGTFEESKPGSGLFYFSQGRLRIDLSNGPKSFSKTFPEFEIGRDYHGGAAFPKSALEMTLKAEMYTVIEQNVSSIINWIKTLEL